MCVIGHDCAWMSSPVFFGKGVKDGCHGAYKNRSETRQAVEEKIRKTRLQDAHEPSRLNALPQVHHRLLCRADLP